MEPSPGDVTSLLDRRASGDREAAAQLVLPGYEAVRLILAFLLLTLVTAARPLFAQTTVGTGSIVGTVSDPSAAVVSGAKITITSVAIGQVINLITNSSGAYNSGALIPGNYRLLVSAKGFSSVDTPVTVLVGNTATVNVSLQVGQENSPSEAFQELAEKRMSGEAAAIPHAGLPLHVFQQAYYSDLYRWASVLAVSLWAGFVRRSGLAGC